MTATVLEGLARPEHAPVTVAHDASIESRLVALRRLQDQHPLWRCALLSGFAQGAFSRDDLRYIFSQYHLYCSSFTRYISAVMANCENDMFRAQLSEDLWKEGGGCEPARSYAQIFRAFLERSLGVCDVRRIAYAPSTREFVRAHLDFAIRSDAMSGSAFLSLGTEEIARRMYKIMRSGLRQAGIPDGELEFFDIRMASDAAHAVTLKNMMVSYADGPGWFDACRIAMNHALDLRMEFYDNIFGGLQQHRLEPLLRRMHDHTSLARGVHDDALCHRHGGDTVAMYSSEVEALNIKFAVERLPLASEVLDPRIVRIPAGKFNKKHKHAHETLIYILEGSGQVLIDDRTFRVEPGDTVLVPRWSLHQTQNLDTTELRFLEVTDFALSHRVFVGEPNDYA